MTGSENQFSFMLTSDDGDLMFESPVLESRLEQNLVLFLVLENRIPAEVFRPVCLPPRNYVKKMVKSHTCSNSRPQKMTKVHSKSLFLITFGS